MLRIRIIAPLIILFAFCLPMIAQKSTGGTRSPTTTFPGINNNRTSEIRVEIQLVNEDSRPLPIQALVEITGMGAVNTRNYTNMDGRVTFNVRSGSNYQVQVSGIEIESGSASFEILPGESFHHEFVTVKLKPQGGTGAPGGMVSLASLNIPENARKEYEKGMKEFRDKKWEKARDHLLKAVEEYPKFDGAYNNLGVIAMQMNDVNAARENFAKAAEANPNNAAATRNLGRIYLTRDKDLIHAKDMLQRSLTAEPKNCETLTLLSFAQLQSGDFDSALSNARKVHSAGPDDKFPFAHLVAGRALEAKGDKVAAAAEYHSYLREAEGSPDAQVAKDGLARLGEK